MKGSLELSNKGGRLVRVKVRVLVGVKCYRDRDTNGWKNIVFPALDPEKDLFLIIKAFVAGVILSTDFIYVLPDAFEKLTSPCLHHHPWGDFPFTEFLAMVVVIRTLIIDSLAWA
ncbi:hypothetical protein VNO78_26461 [Psophocarpus tetragonolobus]|uniref:Uncharacterized protein n=1 Tax=Psophocarpus tetragonolobus TaxID=3891 RepID=A0AAN9RZQ6_PSOTE